ncbi:DUF2958 domain-containing protein [Sneathiella aquimaris]|uniref:DUF2958 domain-containing protein n=1 Tax=Sneathiella aquimaris TaxID=2599305 RepID=UPI00146A0223|nr:DUF2958 domain-containing protein [Sneathiella aquimaris]
MKLLGKRQRVRMLVNGQRNAQRMENEGDTYDFWPVVKLFNPCGAGTWLLTELDPDDPDIAFGLCDLGMGCPELGSVRLSELESIKLMGGALGIERDIHFKAKKSLRAYAVEARQHEVIKA